MISACMATAVELERTRALADAVTSENQALTARLETEKRLTAALTDLNAAQKAEADALRTALAARQETVAAKDAVIAAQDTLIDRLKRAKPSPWRRVVDILTGAAIGVLVR